MAKVSLRIYNREIENLVDSGQLDEAIAHCRHILNTFPKHLETYRMIGKAYLEAKRYDEATDIFERLLMAVPDDFVAHVGMSIIRDEQKDMDAAIWHMQRAFEVQPSNSAIQAELQRLYGRRDGIEPPKIRLTRGALAHMYVQGELYPQAIAEITNVLEEDPERQDMQVLLARAYFHGGQKNEAADMCSQLLRRYPYCFDANRVLVELLPQTEQGESVQTYRKRIHELDPYIPFVTGSVFHTDEVPDAAVSLERLEWDGQPVDMGPEWGESRGIGRNEPAIDDMASTSTEEDNIPDFLREAGWGEDTGTFQEGQSIFDDSDESSEDVPISKGDLPDWVKAMAPTDTEQEADFSQSESLDDDMTEDDAADWLKGLSEAQGSSSDEQFLSEGDLPDWLEAEKPAEEPTPEPESEPELEQAPQEERMAEPAHDDEIPDWLKDIQAQEEDESPVEPLQDAPVMSEESLADWQIDDEDTADAAAGLEQVEMDELGTSASEQDDAIAWLEGLAAKHGAKPEELVTDPNARTETEPDWVQKARATTEQEDIEESEVQEQTPAETSVDLPDFLAHEQSVRDDVTPVVDEQPEVDSALDLPDFLSDKMAETTEQPTAESDDFDIDNLGTSEQEQDDAVAWLESLASRHGAKPEELVTDPEARNDTAPDWVQKAAEAGADRSVGERPTAPPSEELEELAESVLGEQEQTEQAGEDLGALQQESQWETSTPSTEMDETGIWLQELAEEESVIESPEPTSEIETPAMEEDDIPDWLRDMEGEVSQTEDSSTSADESPLPDWLSDLDSGQAESDEIAALSSEMEMDLPESEIEQEVTEFEEPVQEDDSGITDWIKDVETESSESETEAPSAEAEEQAVDDLPSWLSGLDEETEQAQSAIGSDDDLPDWLRDEDEEEPAPPQPTASADWQPADMESAQEEMESSEPEPEPNMEEYVGAAEPEVQVEESVFESEAKDEELVPEPEMSIEEVSAQETIEEETLQAALSPDSEPEPQPESDQPMEAESAPSQEPVTSERSGGTGALSNVQDPAFSEAQSELTRGDVMGAMKSYGRLIRKGRMLDEIIFDLREALYRYPVDVDILQTLGDAYMRADRLQEALDSYTKAEELLR